MVEDLSPMAKKVYEAMKKVGASSEDKLKTADDIMKASGVGKGIVTNSLQELQNKGYIKRVARQKSAGYFIIK
ncbi:MAG: transcriptional regulator [Thermoplasmata archaeon]|jgi:predicted transcriptional regulator